METGSHLDSIENRHRYIHYEHIRIKMLYCRYGIQSVLDGTNDIKNFDKCDA